MSDAAVNLTTRYLGLTLPSPIVVGSCGLTDSVDGVLACEKAGAGAVVLKSVFEEQIAAEVGQLVDAAEDPFWHAEAADYIATYGAENAVNDYLALIKGCKQAATIPVIASINCSTAKGWSKFAQQVEQAGADALELNIFVPPSDPERTGADVEKVYFDVLAEVKKSVSIPVALKVGSFFSSLGQMLVKLSTRGADGLVLFNRFYAPDIDIDRFQVVAGPALSSAEEMSLTLRAVAQLSGWVEGDIAATTGIQDGKGVIKQLLVGATVVQVASTLYRNRVDYIATMLDEVRAWMREKNFTRLENFRGKMNQRAWPEGAAYDRVQFMKRSVHADQY
jgi:dihydroorotate dehydrogenase (fumarate)